MRLMLQFIETTTSFLYLVGCEWGEYGEWTKCSNSCGGGKKYRIRSQIIHNSNEGPRCNDTESETVACNTDPCPIDCKWSEFSSWTSCSRSCGDGKMVRTRKKDIFASNGGKHCEGEDSETVTCNMGSCPVDCVWGEYDTWTTCSKTCGGGTKTRRRSVLIQMSNGGLNCEGGTTEADICNTDVCPIGCTWDQFSEWTTCSTTCGDGKRERTRQKKISASNGDKNCEGKAKETETCNKGPCAVDCKWGEYDLWTSCSKSCGGGIKTRTRSVLIQSSDGGLDCQGDETENVSCNTDACAIDCVWDEFSEWTRCSKSCGDGEKERSRKKNVLASNGGKDCEGEASEKSVCNEAVCFGMKFSKINYNFRFYYGELKM